MPPDVAMLLQDAVTAARIIQQFVLSKGFDDYLSDHMLRSAVERQFTILGEALVQASKLDQTIIGKITSFRQIAGFRNILVHAYAIVSDKTVWGIIEADLTVLIAELEGLISASP
jgi:uncharacterized protein with HEPN domain